MTTLIKNWKELAKVPDSETHRIEVENYSGWILNKTTGKAEEYLSTHTFYKKSGRAGSSIFKNYGFDIEIISQEDQKIKEGE